jgi:hypothetical protein
MTWLLPAESMAFTVAKAQAEHGDRISPNVAVVLVMALDRLVHGNDWTAGEREAALEDYVGDIHDDDEHPSLDDVSEPE